MTRDILDDPSSGATPMDDDLMDTILRSVAEGRRAAGSIDVPAGIDWTSSGTPDEVLGRLMGYRALRATLAILRKCGDEAHNFAIQRLKELVAKISYRFWAPTAWLF